MVLSLADLWNLETEGQAMIISQGSIFYAAAGLAGHGACLFNGHPTILASYNRATGGWETNPDCYKLPEYLKTQNSRRLWEGTDGQWMGHDVTNPDAVSRSGLFTKFEADALVAMIENEPVGADDVTDLLLVNLKAPDFVGHQFGPDSPELRETLVELDHQLARILETLERKWAPSVMWQSLLPITVCRQSRRARKKGISARRLSSCSTKSLTQTVPHSFPITNLPIASCLSTKADCGAGAVAVPNQRISWKLNPSFMLCIRRMR